MALNALEDGQTVEQIQNAVPTDWSALNQQQMDRNDWDKNRFSGDDKLYVKFFMKPRLNTEKSAVANRAVYEDTEYIEIMAPGEKNSIIQRPAWSQDYERFPKHYALFKQGKREQEVGTPLSMAPFLTEAQVEELRYFKVRTIENLAGLSDSVMQNFMGARELQQKAQAYLFKLTSGDSLLARINDQDKVIAELRALLEQKTEPTDILN
jgi:hypothetical protein